MERAKLHGARHGLLALDALAKEPPGLLIKVPGGPVYLAGSFDRRRLVQPWLRERPARESPIELGEAPQKSRVLGIELKAGAVGCFGFGESPSVLVRPSAIHKEVSVVLLLGLLAPRLVLFQGLVPGARRRLVVPLPPPYHGDVVIGIRPGDMVGPGCVDRLLVLLDGFLVVPYLFERICPVKADPGTRGDLTVVRERLLRLALTHEGQRPVPIECRRHFIVRLGGEGLLVLGDCFVIALELTQRSAQVD